jgi:hypothetical protein
MRISVPELLTPILSQHGEISGVDRQEKQIGEENKGRSNHGGFVPENHKEDTRIDQ